MNWEKLIEAYSLKNAIEHDGKAQESRVISSLFHEGLKPEEIKEVIKLVKETINKINSWTLLEQKAKYAEIEKLTSKRKVREGLPELPNAKGKPVLRLAPYPSGPLHIGNARTYLINDYYAKKYKGKLIFIMDDTIGSEEKPIAKDAYKLIPEGFDWLGIKYKKPIIYRSDRLNIYYEYAEKLIRMNKAYVCSCSQEKIKGNREKMKECACRQYPVKQQLERWKKMFDAKPGELVLRIKTSMEDRNPAFRDRVLLKIADRIHPRVGKKYRVWPLLDFSNSIDDHLLEITHIIRGKDLMIESDMEKFIWNIFGWKHAEIIHTGLLRLKGIKISKSKGQQEIKSGKYTGWDDPRTWSIQSLEKRGIQAEALKEFLLDFGLTERETEASLESLYAKNRELLHPIAKKVSFTLEKGNAKIIMDTGEVVYGSVPGKLKKGIYHLLKWGYCNLVKPGRINEFWFAHP